MENFKEKIIFELYFEGIVMCCLAMGIQPEKYTITVWCSLLHLGYKPVQHVNVQTTQDESSTRGNNAILRCVRLLSA